MADDRGKARLDALDARIEAAKKSHAPAPKTEDHHAQAQLAWQMVIELVAGLAIGFGIGFGLDALFGTAPFLMLLFTLLGFAAGVKTMLRTAKLAQEKTAADAAAKRGAPDSAGDKGA